MPSTMLKLSFFISFLLFILNVALSANVIDRCWRGPNWAANRQHLATCSVGYSGKMVHNAGHGVTHYIVEDAGDDPLHPGAGTLRYGTSMVQGKVWITFARDMHIRLMRPLLISSFTTIDGRGADVHIEHGAGFLIQQANDVIIHGLKFHNIVAMPAGPVIGPGGKITDLGDADADAIRIVSSRKIWLDHNTLYEGHDGLVDVTRGSTAITISNNWFRDHDKVMLLGHDDEFVGDRDMQVTLAFNRFGPNCVQRMPRIRHGYAHVVNNFYDGWKDYAMGGSMNPTIKSQGNLYVAPHTENKAVIWKESGPGRGTEWNLKSVDDTFVNGAFFQQVGNARSPNYGPDEAFTAESSQDVQSLTRDAGAFHCREDSC